jgi:hypothetical protein
MSLLSSLSIRASTGRSWDGSAEQPKIKPVMEMRGGGVGALQLDIIPPAGPFVVIAGALAALRSAVLHLPPVAGAPSVPGTIVPRLTGSAGGPLDRTRMGRRYCRRGARKCPGPAGGESVAEGGVVVTDQALVFVLTKGHRPKR